MSALDLNTIDRLTGARIGRFDVPCPLCGPFKSRTGQYRKVLRIWRVDEAFAGFVCQRCGAKGYTRGLGRATPDPAKLARARAEAAERERAAVIERLGKSRWLWSRRRAIAGTPAEVYLREARGYSGPIPATLAYLPPTKNHPPSVIATFGLAAESEPGVIAIANDAVRGVHLTKLAADGSGKAGTELDKIIIGRCVGVPIVLAPVNDLGGLVITEGIEDALSVSHCGLGVWVAGAGGRMAALARAVPAYVEAVTIVVDADPIGEAGSGDLARALGERGIEVRLARAAT
jgi:hypothetical protein